MVGISLLPHAMMSTALSRAKVSFNHTLTLSLTQLFESCDNSNLFSHSLFSSNQGVGLVKLCGNLGLHIYKVERISEC